MNPLKEAAPWARITTLLVVGAAVLYGLGRWDAAIDHKLLELKAETARVIDVVKATRSWADSVRALEDSLERADAALEIQERQTRAVLRELALADSQVVARAETAELDSLLPLLRMRPLQFADTTWYAVDSAQVRVLARGLLRVPVLEAQRDSLRSLVATQSARISTLQSGWDASRLRGDSLTVALDLTAPVLEAWQKHSSCKILWVISCPSRTTSAIIGVVLGGAAVYIGTKE